MKANMPIMGSVPQSLTLCLVLAACQPQAGREPYNDTAGDIANEAMNPEGNGLRGTGSAPAESKSILRPEVILPDIELPKIEPVHAVIPFDQSGMKIDEAGRVAIDAVLATPIAAAGGPIILRGHTDSQGSDRDNRAASRARAERVRDYLVEKGIAPDRITVIALGETRPAAPNANPDGSDYPEGRAKNRRVEIDLALPSGEGTANDIPNAGGKPIL